ncbi:MAG TPA: hydroxymethylbilane synthase [Steroidobacteraceae bacterium]|nr:hydroxymethylbilane synthase [Steroidobacteraceae bacterium]
MTPRLRIATRKSQLALWQAEHVSALLRAAHPGLQIELVPLLTQGDRIQDRTLAAIGGKGLFIKELEVALEELRADIAVHSMKDVPADLPPGLIIGAVLKRADPRDALVTTSGVARLEDLPRGAVVGTSSLRRQAQIRALRPDLNIESLRGNVDTRLRKLDAGQDPSGTHSGGATATGGKPMDAIVLACAGLIRLGLESRITARLDPEVCLPAVTQGVIGIECRQSDSSTVEYLRALEDPATRKVMDAERAFAARLGGSCQSPIAAYAVLESDRITLRGLVAEPDGSRLLRDTVTGSAENPAALGRQLAERILAAGAGPLLERLRAN